MPLEHWGWQTASLTIVDCRALNHSQAKWTCFYICIASSLLGLENSGYPVSLTISFSVLEACLQTQSQCTLLFWKGSIAVRGGRDTVTSAIPVLVRIHTNFWFAAPSWKSTTRPTRLWGFHAVLMISMDSHCVRVCHIGLALCAHRLFMTCWSRGARIHPRQARQVLLQTEKWRVLKMALWHTLTVFVSIRFFVIVR